MLSFLGFLGFELIERMAFNMPLKRTNVKRQVVKVEEGNPLQTPDNQVMSLFSKAMLPAVTLNVEQFGFPKSFVVMSVERIDEVKRNPVTGWALKDSGGSKIKTGNHFMRLMLADGDLAQEVLDHNGTLDALKQIQCTITKDIPIQKFEPQVSLVKLVKPVVMLGFGGQNVDRIVLQAEDCELV